MKSHKPINIITQSKCQLRCNFCINSKIKNDINEDVFTYDNFVKTIDILIQFGFNVFELTPTIGDIFLDDDIEKKLLYLEGNDKVKKYEFVTNFLGVTKSIIKILSKSKKGECAISIYGYDPLSYKELTGVNAYYKFFEKLSLLYDLCKNIETSTFMFYMRYSILESFPISDIKIIILDMLKTGSQLENAETVNRNWGGMMPENMSDAITSKKQGICSRLINENGIYSNGDITGCNCWDWKKELILGNINKQSLDEIYSRNTKYGKLLTDQFKNIYEGPCIVCDDFSPVRSYHLDSGWIKMFKIFYKSEDMNEKNSIDIDHRK